MDDVLDTGGNTPESSPASFAEAFAAEASPASDPSQQQTTPSAAAQPTAASETTASDDRSPFIPRHRFDEVNGKLSKWKEQYGWAEQVDRPAVEQAVELARRYQADKVGFLQELIADAQNDPQAAQQLRSMAARALAAGRGQQPTTETGLPNVEITDAQGNVIGTLNDILAAERQRVLEAVRSEFAPVVKTAKDVEEERAALKAQHDAHQFAGSTMQDASQWPGMDVKENRLAVKARIESYGITSDDPRDLQIALNRAWRETVLPKLTHMQRSAVLTDQQHKAAVNTAHPSHQASGAPKSYSGMSFEEAFKHEWAAAQGAR